MGKKICVLGAGVVGLSTALRLTELCATANITIIAKEFNNSTTSDGAGGLFRPDNRFMPGVDRKLAEYDRLIGNFHILVIHINTNIRIFL